jgi:pimeloyl-ACP methyl ester carboxylesterase
MTQTRRTLQLPTFEIDLAFDDSGTGPAALVLHGGGGPFTVAGLGAHLAETHRVLVPTLPGWNSEPRPDALTSVSDLADTFLALLADLGLSDVVVLGSSLGGWIASDMAVRDTAGLVGRVVVIDGAGVKIEGEDFVQFFSLTPREIAEHSWHDADKFFVDPATLPAERVAAQAANLATMGLLAGDPYMHDPALLGKLPAVAVPTLVLWGESDRVFTPEYGRAYAAAFGDGRFELIAEAGHLPQLEQPAATFAAVDAFVA